MNNLENNLLNEISFSELMTGIEYNELINIIGKEHFHGKKSDFHTGTGRRY